MWVPLFIGLFRKDYWSNKGNAYLFPMKDLSLMSVRLKSFVCKT